MNLFAHACNQKNIKKDPAAAELCRLFGYHPYAIALAGAMMIETHRNPAQLYQRLKDRPLDVEKGHQQIITQILDETWDSLGIDEQRILLVFGAFFVPGMSAALLSAYCRVLPAALGRPLDELVRRNLVRANRAVDYYELHDLTFRYAQARFEAGGLGIDASITCAITYIEDNLHAYNLLGVDLPNLLECARHADPVQAVHMLSLLTLGGDPLPASESYLGVCGHTSLLLERLKDAVVFARSLGSDYRTVLHYLATKCGNIHFERGNYPAAEACYEEAVQLAPDQIRLLVTGSLTARARFFCDRVGEAYALFEQAHQISAELQDPFWESFILEQESLAYSHIGDYEAVRRAAAAQLEINQKLVDEQRSPENLEALFYSLNNLGSAELDLAEKQRPGVKRAYALHHRAYHVAQEQMNPVLHAYALMCLGEDYHLLGDPDMAESCFCTALHIWRQRGMKAEEKAAIEKMEHYGYNIPPASAGQ